MEIWGFFGIYAASQVIASFFGTHYFWDSVMFVLSTEILESCEDHPGFCEDFDILGKSETEMQESQSF